MRRGMKITLMFVPLLLGFVLLALVAQDATQPQTDRQLVCQTAGAGAVVQNILRQERQHTHHPVELLYQHGSDPLHDLAFRCSPASKTETTPETAPVAGEDGTAMVTMETSPTSPSTPSQTMYWLNDRELFRILNNVQNGTPVRLTHQTFHLLPDRWLMSLGTTEGKETPATQAPKQNAQETLNGVYTEMYD